MIKHEADTAKAARLERELERERRQHAHNQEAKTGFHLDDADRLKDARENVESGRRR